LNQYSLLRRITVVLAITMAAGGISTFGWLYLKIRWVNTGLHQETLLDQAHVIAGYIVVDENGVATLNLPPRLAEAYSSHSSSYRYAVRDANGQFLFNSASIIGPLPNFLNRDYRLYSYDPDGTGPLNVLGAALRTVVDGRPFFIQVEQESHHTEHAGTAAINEFLADGGWVGILFMLIVLGASILIVRRAIAPLKRISDLAETIGPTRADVRLPTENVPREILPLVRSMNSALDRLNEGLRRQREFNANAAHQLRTPLAVLMANMDTLENSEFGKRTRTDIVHMSRIVSQLLLDARLDTFSVTLDEVIDLNVAAEEIAASFAPLALASKKTIALLRSDDPVTIRTSGFALRAALGNLIENAINHTPERTSVRVRVTNRPAIEVMDSGPGIPHDQRARVFERFWRGDRNSSGAGLGLSIVDRIMQALNGSVKVDACPDGGALFTLVFPSVAGANLER
jgi:signal transduction histidine kinase